MKTLMAMLVVLVTVGPVLPVSAVMAQERPGLMVGTPAPDLTGVDHSGQEVSLSAMYQDGPLVLIFYRGGWCHYCNLQLQDYQQHYQEFVDRRASILAVSVDLAANAAQTVSDKELSFMVISDPQAEWLKRYNAEFTVPADLASKYKEEYDIDLEAASGRSDRLIAVPATYIIDQSGTIVFAHSDLDYKVRKSASEVLAALDILLVD